MNSILLLVGVSAGFAHSVYSAFSKSLLKSRISEPFLLLLYINLFQAFITPTMWLFVKPALPSPGGWTPLLMAAATCVVGYVFLYEALCSGDVSSVMPIMGSKVIFSGFLAIPMLGESHSGAVYVAALLVGLCIAMLSYSPSHTRSSSFPLKPIGLMITSCIVFSFTDIYIKRSLTFLDPYNFIIYYNLIVGVGSLAVVPHIRKKRVSLVLKGRDVWLTLISSVSLVVAMLLFVVTCQMAHGVVVPNILMSTRGVFVVIIGAVLTHRGSTILERQHPKVYLLRFLASGLIVVAIWITLHN